MRINRLRAVDRRLIVLFVIVFVNFLGASMVQPVLPIYASQEFGARPELISLLLAAFFIAQFIAAPFLGRISDHRGRRPVLIASQIGTVASFGLMAAATSMSGLFAARIIDGITGGNVIVAQAYITDVTTREKRTQGLGVIFAAFGLGHIFGPALGGLISAVADAHATFMLAAAVSALSLVLTWRVLPESLTPERRRERTQRVAKMRVQDITGNQALLIILLIGFCAQFSIAVMQSTLPMFGEAVLFASEPANLQSLGVGLLLTGIGIGQLATQIFILRPAVQYIGERRLVVAGAFFRGLGILTIGLFSTPLLVGSVSLVMVAVASGLMMPSLQSLATTSSAEEISGGVLGVYNSSTTLGLIFGTALGGVMFAASPQLPYTVGGLVLMATMLPALALYRTLRPRLTSAAAAT